MNIERWSSVSVWNLLELEKRPNFFLFIQTLDSEFFDSENH